MKPLRCVTASPMSRSQSWKTVSSCGQCNPFDAMKPLGSQSRLLSQVCAKRPTSTAGHEGFGTHQALSQFGPASAIIRPLSSPAEARGKQRALDRETIMSVLEASATKRDAKGYLQKYTAEKPSLTKMSNSPADQTQVLKVQEEVQLNTDPRTPATTSHVAVVKLRCPQYLDNDTANGVARTLSQLRTLGLLSVVIIDCGLEGTRATIEEQAAQLCQALDSFTKSGSKVLNDIMVGSQKSSSTSILESGLRVDDSLGRLRLALERGLIPVVPAVARPDDIRTLRPVDAHAFVLTLTKYLAGLQFATAEEQVPSPDTGLPKPAKIAEIERIIVLDPLGATPVSGRPGASHRFVNLEQEYDTLLKQLMGPEGSPLAQKDQCIASSTIHASNLDLVKEALSILPSSSSALITTPLAAAGIDRSAPLAIQSSFSDHQAAGSDFSGIVTTRTRQNPLLHNLLTDKPVYSSSLPVKRIQDPGQQISKPGPSSGATLVKRGMPLTIFPNPRLEPWTPPKPGGPRLRLTDTCIDLPRLVYLIEDSFNRKLDVQDYLNRVNENLAGIIIAGEYEGGAILTWEQPEGLDYQTAYEQCRLVPYLDKFAVLKSRQGSGGVADIVFNAMVIDCFPEGVSWRSRKDNPVNKWYFERSLGTSKLDGCNWTMFWTTQGLYKRHPKLRDYESVCRKVEPSWANNKHILD